jgi:hypothetical protein
MPEVLWDHAHPGIYIDVGLGTRVRIAVNRVKTGSFFQLACDALNTIRSRPIGKALLRTITAKCQMDSGRKDLKVVIIEAGEGIDNSAEAVHVEGAVRIPGQSDFCGFVAGEGSGSVVYWNPYESSVQQKEFHAFTGLAHELIHAMHNLHGDLVGLPKRTKLSDPKSALAHEEARTTGIGLYADEPISENAIRKEHNIELRTTYGGLEMKHLTKM